jgi:adenine/guanine phosphoribosyltransferase-like PRPP-binding protein
MTTSPSDIVTYDNPASGYLPHLQVEKLDKVVEIIEVALRDVLHEFDGVLCQGLSGIIPASIFCWRHGKQLVVLRKAHEKSHGAWLEGKFPERYIIIEDFVSYGDTMGRLLKAAEMARHDLPRYIVMYAALPHRDEYIDRPKGFDITRPKEYADRGINRFTVTRRPR